MRSYSLLNRRKGLNCCNVGRVQYVYLAVVLLQALGLCWGFLNCQCTYIVSEFQMETNEKRKTKVTHLAPIRGLSDQSALVCYRNNRRLHKSSLHHGTSDVIIT